MSQLAYRTPATFSEDWYEPAVKRERGFVTPAALSQKRGIESSMLNEMMSWPAMVLHWMRQRFSGKDDIGASLVEYALLLALIAVVAITALVFLGHSVSNTLNQVANSVNSTNS